MEEGHLQTVDHHVSAILAKLGVARFRTFAAHRDVRVSVTLAQRLVTAARQALVTPEAAVARQVQQPRSQNISRSSLHWTRRPGGRSLRFACPRVPLPCP